MPETEFQSHSVQQRVREQTDRSFPRSRRLLTKSDFNRVFERATVRAGTGELFALASPASDSTEQPQARLGFIVARKHVRRAVKRNLIKRIAREEFRLLDPALPPLDIIVMARKGADKLDRQKLHEAVRYLFRKLRQRHNETQSTLKGLEQ